MEASTASLPLFREIAAQTLAFFHLFEAALMDRWLGHGCAVKAFGMGHMLA